MSAQLDLFAPPPAPSRKPWSPEDDYPGWEARYLADLAERPLTACYPGFAGAMLERLAAKGHAIREDAGFMDPEAMNISAEIQATKAFKTRVRAYWRDPSPMFRYAITPAGLAALDLSDD